MRRFVIGLVCAWSAALAPAAAQQPAAVTYVDAGKVAAAFAAGGRLGSGSDFTASGARRTGPGQVEVHQKETDIFYIIDGAATFVTGGTMIGGQESRPDQLLGSSIEGGEVRQLKKGDLIVIPAGTPHWFKDVPQSINYYMVKYSSRSGPAPCLRERCVRGDAALVAAATARPARPPWPLWFLHDRSRCAPLNSAPA